VLPPDEAAPKASSPPSPPSESEWEAAEPVGSSSIIPVATEAEIAAAQALGSPGASAPRGALAIEPDDENDDPVLEVRVNPAARSEPRLPMVRVPAPGQPSVVPAPVPTPTEPFGSIAAPSEPTLESLPHEVQEQIFGILRAAIEASPRPVWERQEHLEARMEQLRTEESVAQAAARAAATAAAAAVAAAAAAASPPAFNQTLPLAHSPQHQPAQPNPMRPRAPSLSVDITPSEPRMPSKRPSAVPTSYGYVITPEGGSRRPPIEVALEHVGPIDMPDFGGNRRLVGRLLVGLLIAGLVAAALATILSYS
jgi:hypothetical protein